MTTIGEIPTPGGKIVHNFDSYSNYHWNWMMHPFTKVGWLIELWSGGLILRASISISLLIQSVFLDPMTYLTITISTISIHHAFNLIISTITFTHWISSSPKNSTLRSKRWLPTPFLLVSLGFIKTNWRQYRCWWMALKLRMVSLSYLLWPYSNFPVLDSWSPFLVPLVFQT